MRVFLLECVPNQILECPSPECPRSAQSLPARVGMFEVKYWSVQQFWSGTQRRSCYARILGSCPRVMFTDVSSVCTACTVFEASLCHLIIDCEPVSQVSMLQFAASEMRKRACDQASPTDIFLTAVGLGSVPDKATELAESPAGMVSKSRFFVFGFAVTLGGTGKPSSSRARARTSAPFGMCKIVAGCGRVLLRSSAPRVTEADFQRCCRHASHQAARGYFIMRAAVRFFPVRCFPEFQSRAGVARAR